jgi:hypothetical protein
MVVDGAEREAGRQAEGEEGRHRGGREREREGGRDVLASPIQRAREGMRRSNAEIKHKEPEKEREERSHAEIKAQGKSWDEKHNEKRKMSRQEATSKI